MSKSEQEPGVGHNSLAGEDDSGSFLKGQLKSIVDRIERLDDQRAEISEDIKEVYSEAKANGFDTKILRKVIQRRKMDREARAEMDTMVDLYEASLGDLFA